MHGLGRPFINRSSEFYCVASPVLSHAMEMWMFAGMMSIEGTLKTECVRRSFIFQSCSLKRLKLKLIKMLFGIKLFVFVVYFISYLGIPITQPLGRQVCVVVTFFHAQCWNKSTNRCNMFFFKFSCSLTGYFIYNSIVWYPNSQASRNWQLCIVWCLLPMMTT